MEIQSSQDFIRALKAPSDPPSPGLQIKIEIARQAWSTSTLYIPRKGEVIAEWILSKFLKDRTRTPESNPLFDKRYWVLLADIIVSEEQKTVALPPKKWLTSLLARVPVTPVMVSFINLLPLIDQGQRRQLTSIVCDCIVAIWLQSFLKTSPDTLAECFGAVLRVVDLCAEDESLAKIGCLIASSFRTNQSNASNSKKALLVFLENYLQTWMGCAAVQERYQGIHRNLLDHIDMIGIEALFSLDNLRRNRDPSFSNLIFDKLEDAILISPILSLGVLPRMFSSYVQRLKQHRSALYAQGSNQGIVPDGLLTDGMSFFAMCNGLVDKASFAAESWSARLALLSVVEKENLYSAAQRDGEQSLKHLGQLAIDALDISKQPIEQTGLVIDIISTLMRIDFDILGQAVPNVLSKLILATHANSSAILFLDVLVDHHSKTRTLPIYIRNLLATLSLVWLSPDSTLNVYHTASSGPLMHISHLDKLGKSVHSNLPAGQILEVANIISHSLRGAWTKLSSFSCRDKDGGSKKRIRLESHPEPMSGPQALAAISFALSYKLAGFILPLLPVQSVVKSTKQEIRGVIDDMQTTLIHLPLKQFLKIVRKRPFRDEWPAEVITAAILKLWYTLNRTGFLIPRQLDHRTVEELIQASQDSGNDPELILEIFRALLCHCEQQYPSKENSERVVTNLFDYLEYNFSGSDDLPLTIPYYCGKGVDQTDRAATTLLHMTIQRWLPVLDLVASEQHLKRLVKLLAGIFLRSGWIHSTCRMRKRPCLAEALFSAQFWEQSKLRNTLLSYLEAETSILDQFDARKYLVLGRGSMLNRSLSLQQVQDAALRFSMALYIPVDYLTKSCRAELVRRALAADVFISSSSSDQAALPLVLESLTTLRTFLQKTLSNHDLDHTLKNKAALMSHLATPTMWEFLENILNPTGVYGQSTIEYTSSTLDLFEGFIIKGFNDKSNSQGILRIIDTFMQLDFSTSLSSDMLHQNQMKQCGLLRFIKLMTSHYSRTDFTDVVIASLFALQKHLHSSILPPLSVLLAERSPAIIFDYQALFEAWCQTLSLGRWLQMNRAVPRRFGHALVTKVLNCRTLTPSSGPDLKLAKVTAAVLAVLLEEFHTYDAKERTTELDVIVSACAVLYRAAVRDDRTELDLILAGAGRQFTIPEFSHILEFVLESLSSPSDHGSDLVSLVRLISILSHASPEGTMNILKRATTQCLNIFTNYDEFSRGSPSLRQQVLDFIIKLTSDRPAALQPIGLGSIWSLLYKFVAGFPEHDVQTSVSTFHDITAIVSSLIRLRQDLVISTLPHLAMILRQLIMSLRQPRPQLGAKQSRLVADSMPLWINPASPLTAHEGRALARLLTGLTTKSVVRSQASFTDTQKAESLANPFSKHALFVLKAYIDIMNDPLCIVPLEIRKSLQPGLFSICDMLNEHNRDTLMVSIPSDGKLTMKLLWKEYEKQRYVGKG